MSFEIIWKGGILSGDEKIAIIFWFDKLKGRKTFMIYSKIKKS